MTNRLTYHGGSGRPIMRGCRWTFDAFAVLKLAMVILSGVVSCTAVGGAVGFVVWWVMS